MRKRFHPGLFLQELLEWQRIGPTELSQVTGIDESVIIGITKQRYRVDETVSEALAEYFGNSAKFWNNLQRSFDRK